MAKGTTKHHPVRMSGNFETKRPCGWNCKAITEKQFNLLIKLHSKKCESCLNQKDLYITIKKNTHHNKDV